MRASRQARGWAEDWDNKIVRAQNDDGASATAPSTLRVYAMYTYPATSSVLSTTRTGCTGEPSHPSMSVADRVLVSKVERPSAIPFVVDRRDRRAIIGTRLTDYIGYFHRLMIDAPLHAVIWPIQITRLKP